MDAPRVRKERRRRSDVISPTAGAAAGLDVVALGGLTAATVGMAALFGGTLFWASGPFFVLGLLMVWMCQVLALRSGLPLQFAPPPGTVAWMLLTGYALLRAVFTPRIPYQAWTEVMQLGGVLMFYIALADLTHRRNIWRVVLGVFLVSVVAQALYALSLHLRGLNDVLWLSRPESYGMRASGTFICPNHFAQLLQIGMVLGFGLLLTPKAGPALKIVSGFAFVTSLPAMYLTGSRAGWLGVLAGLSVVAVCKALRRGAKVTVLTLSGLVGLFAGLFGVLWMFSPMFQDRIQRAIRGDVRVRALWPDTWRLIQEEGFWGAGPGMFRHLFERYRFHFDRPELYLRHAHNEYLHVIADYGWPGLAVVVGGMIGVVWILLRALWRQESESNAMIPIMMLGVFAAVGLHSAFDFNAHIPGIMVNVVLVMGVLYGHGMYRGIWRPFVWPGWAGMVALWMGMIGAPLMAAGFFILAMGSHSEFRMDAARKEGDAEMQRHYAGKMRKWTPFQWRGWREKGFHYRSEAFWTPEEEKRRELAEKSREAYEVALRWNPYDRISMMGLAQLEIREGRHEAAVEVLEDLMVVDPFDAHLHVEYGLTLRRLGKYEEALEVFERANRLKRGDRQIQLNLEWLRERI